MIRLLRILLVIMLLTSACTRTSSEVSRAEAEAIAWQALEPYTSSHQAANWKVSQSRQVKGDELPEIFQKERVETCFNRNAAPPPPPEEFQPAGRYWLVVYEPLPATPKSTALSPTDPPHIPEPFVRQATLLIELQDGELAGFRLGCVIY